MKFKEFKGKPIKFVDKVEKKEDYPPFTDMNNSLLEVLEKAIKEGKEGIILIKRRGKIEE